MKHLYPLLALLVACGSAESHSPTSLEAVARSALSCPIGTLAWSVVEGTGGTIDQAGNYTAPPCNANQTDATYHIRVSGCGNTTEIPVQVGDNVQSVAIYCGVILPETCCRPPPWTVAPGTQIQLYAAVRYSCAGHVVYSATPPAMCP